MTAELNARKFQTQPDFKTRYDELASVGVRDVDMVRHFSTTYKKFADLCRKYGYSCSPLLAEIAGQEEKRR